MGFFSSIVKAVAGPVVGGALDLIGGEKANESNISSAREANQFSAEEAQKQRNFSHEQNRLAEHFTNRETNEARNYLTQMSNSAHQRQVKDLEAAGLNPILSARYGGASTPPSAGGSGAAGGGAAASGKAAVVKNTVGPAAATALAIRRGNADVKQIAETTRGQTLANKNTAQENKNLKEQENEIRARITNLNASSAREMATYNREQTQAKLNQELAEKAISNTKLNKQTLTVGETQLFKHRQAEKIDRSETGQMLQFLNRFNPFSSSAKSVIGTVRGR